MPPFGRRVCVCVCNPWTHRAPFGVVQGGQACHILPGPTKPGCNRGCIKGRLDVYLHVGFVLVPPLGKQDRCLSFPPTL